MTWVTAGCTAFPSQGEWQQLSRDHTVLNGMIARGEAEEGEEYANVYNMLDFAWRQTPRMLTLTSTTALPLFCRVIPCCCVPTECTKPWTVHRCSN